MKISTHDGPTNRWGKPETVTRIVWFKDMSWGYAHNASGPICSLTKIEASGQPDRDWVRITEAETQPPCTEVVASTGG